MKNPTKVLRGPACLAPVLMLLALSATCGATSVTTTFNPIPWFSLNPLTSPEFTYTITVTSAEVGAVSTGQGPGFTWNQMDIGLPSGSGLSGSGSGTGANYSITSGPPSTLHITTVSGGFTAGNSVTMTSADDPTSTLPLKLKFTPIDSTVPPPTIGTSLIADAGPLGDPSLSIPVLGSPLTPGGTQVTGTASPDTYVFAFQNDNTDAIGRISLGMALVGGNGAFDISLARPLLPGDLVSIGVSSTYLNVNGSAQIALQETPVPEAPAFWLVFTPCLFLLARLARTGRPARA
jgi:hypothetical protein